LYVQEDLVKSRLLPKRYKQKQGSIFPQLGSSMQYNTRPHIGLVQVTKTFQWGQCMDCTSPFRSSSSRKRSNFSMCNESATAGQAASLRVSGCLAVAGFGAARARTLFSRQRQCRHTPTTPVLLRRAIAGEESRTGPDPALDLESVLRRCTQLPSVDLWTLVGDFVVLLLVAPALAVFFVRVKVWTPSWLELVRQSGDAGFIFPEAAHAAAFAVCWFSVGLAAGAFEALAVTPVDLIATLRRTWKPGYLTFIVVMFLWSLQSATGVLLPNYAAMGFETRSQVCPSLLDFAIDLQFFLLCLGAWRFTRAVSLTGSPVEEEKSITDAKLLVGDILVSGVVVPSLIVTVFFQTHVYTPGWLEFWRLGARDLSSATLAHGASLSFCWLIGAFIAGGYRAGAVNSRDLAATLKRTWIVGAAATVLLLMITVLSSLLSVPDGQAVTEFDSNRRLVYSGLDLVLDVQFSALCLTTWRLKYSGLL